MSINLVKILYCTTIMLFICGMGLSFGLEKQDGGSEMTGLSLSKIEMNTTNIAMDPLKSGLAETLKKTQKVKKRPGVSAIDYVTNVSIEPYHEDWSSENVTESSVISLNIPRLSNNSSMLISGKVDAKNLSILLDDAKFEDPISSGNLSNSTFVPITNVDSEMPSSAESSAKIKLREDLKKSEVRNGNKFILENDASKISKITKFNNRSNVSLAKNEMMFSGGLSFYKANLSDSDTNENSTVLSHKPKPVLVKDDAAVPFRDNQSLSLSPKTLKIMSKPSTATMGEIDKMSSGNVVLISSIIGIICLCALIGIIAYKRIYAYWYRRHYSRVDFLIDGLYEM